MVRDGLKFINSSVFREDALYFKKNEYYTDLTVGTYSWRKFWDERKRRCIEGYEVDNVKITGDHYHYLNYCPILKVPEGIMNSKNAKKVKDFPDFWDGDYNYFWVREIARNGVLPSFVSPEEESRILELDKKEKEDIAYSYFKSLKLFVDTDPEYLFGGFNLIVGKSRRKGYSYKAGAKTSKNYHHIRDSYTILAANDKKYLFPKGLHTMFKSYSSFINQHTPFAMPSDYVNKVDHSRASYKEYINGIEVEKGFMSEVQAITFGDNADAARGKDAYDVYFEESGAFGLPGHLKNSYKATEDCVKAGSKKTGMITVFGTSGDMDKGSVDYADMMMRPLAYGFLPLKNLLDENSADTFCGFFHPVNWNMEGFYDENGNSDFEGAKQYELDERVKLVQNGATISDIRARMQERPLSPSEAFFSGNNNNFPVYELNARAKYIKSKNLHLKKGTPVRLEEEGKIVTAKRILDGTLEPIYELKNLPKTKTGCVVIYEEPMPNAPKGLYKIGYDPVRQNIGPSLAAIIVYKSFHSGLTGSYYNDNIVAEYIGRFEDQDRNDEIAELLAKYYGTKVMHENEVTSVKTYFQKRKLLNLLAAQPDRVIKSNIKNSTVARVYGCHMVIQLKDAAERYTNTWLRKVIDYDENGKPITTVDRLDSLRLIEELIAYHHKGNFDLLSAFFMCIIQVEEQTLNKDYSKTNNRIDELINLYKN